MSVVWHQNLVCLYRSQLVQVKVKKGKLCSRCHRLDEHASWWCNCSGFVLQAKIACPIRIFVLFSIDSEKRWPKYNSSIIIYYPIWKAWISYKPKLLTRWDGAELIEFYSGSKPEIITCGKIVGSANSLEVWVVIFELFLSWCQGLETNLFLLRQSYVYNNIAIYICRASAMYSVLNGRREWTSKVGL